MCGLLFRFKQNSFGRIAKAVEILLFTKFRSIRRNFSKQAWMIHVFRFNFFTFSPFEYASSRMHIAHKYAQKPHKSEYTKWRFNDDTNIHSKFTKNTQFDGLLVLFDFYTTFFHATQSLMNISLWKQKHKQK